MTESTDLTLPSRLAKFVSNQANRRPLTELYLSPQTLEDIRKWDSTVCRQADGYVLDRWHWFVTLNNGETVFQDDYRPGLAEPMAWRRLRSYCRENNLSITSLKLRFRSHVETPLPDNQKGYFFAHNAMSLVGLTGSIRDGVTSTLDFCLLGYIERATGLLRVTRWKVPELIPSAFMEGGMEEIRPIDHNSPYLITEKS